VCRTLGIRHDTSNPHRSETNGLIERINRTVIEGARCLLYQSGLPHKYWPTAVKCFADNYNFTHYDSKKGTNSHVKRHGKTFGGKPLPYGCKIRYLPHAENEVQQREKLEPALRDGIFVGYRSHTGGKWTEQYEIIDFKAFTEIVAGTGRRAHVHAASEVYIPGSAGDDQEKHPTFPVADGFLSESTGAPDEESSEEFVTSVEDLQTELEETLLSSSRGERDHEDPDPQNAGGVSGRATEAGEDEYGAGVPDQDSWHIEGDYLVRVHRVPRTTLFSPLDVPDDPPPIDVKNIEVLRTTKPVFSGTQWPEMETIEDAWSGNASDARILQTPDDGSTLTWTGETLFERVMPQPPKGKAWCMGELVNIRRGTKRADDVHPLQWWLLSESARIDAAKSWKIKHGEILRAQHRRSIPSEPLEKMPPSTRASAATTIAAVPVFMTTKLENCSPVSKGNTPALAAASSITDTRTKRPSSLQRAATTTTNTIDMYEGFDWANLPTTATTTTNTNTADVPPELVDDSSDEEPYQRGENYPECSE